METHEKDSVFLEACRRPLLGGNVPPARTLRSDVIIVGAGIAGLTLALRLPASFRVALLTKGALGESNTRWAQGGLSAAIGEDDSPELHEIDTIAAGAGLCDPHAVHELVEGAPAAVEWLLALDTHFDRDDKTGALMLGREAAHSRRRVLHAGGDATGAEIERALVAAVRKRSNIDVYAGAFAIDLFVEAGRCTGIDAELAPGEGPVRITAPAVAIAAGGAGQLWATTSNPPAATADGLAMALRAGATVADIEFVQFHPTVLSLPGSVPFLVSEAVRGEGAYLRGADDERFMVALHPLAELAPRDVVARGIQRQMALDHADHVSLDLRHLDREAMRRRFPTIAAELARRGLDLATDLIPVAPAAHYFMGGIAAGTDGTTSLPGLLALGEASCTGIHGANRLASNSLLEGLVFGIHTADRVARELIPSSESSPLAGASLASISTKAPTELDALRVRIQRTMSRNVAVVRDARGLSEATTELDDVIARLATVGTGGRRTWETANMALAARAITGAALRRRESRGAHFRADCPETDSQLDGLHLVVDRRGAWRYASLAEAQAAMSGERADR